MAGLQAFTCPDCGLVIEASHDKGVAWLADHRAFAHHAVTLSPPPPRLKMPTGWIRPQPLEELRAIAQDLATGHKWRTALTVADAEFLHQLEIDPT